MGGADFVVGSTGECSRPAPVGELVDEGGRLARGPLQGRRLLGAEFRVVNEGGAPTSTSTGESGDTDLEGVEQQDAEKLGIEQDDTVQGVWTSSWASGRRPGRLDGVSGGWTTTWASGRRLGLVDADLSARTMPWTSGRRTGDAGLVQPATDTAGQLGAVARSTGIPGQHVRRSSGLVLRGRPRKWYPEVNAAGGRSRWHGGCTNSYTIVFPLHSKGEVLEVLIDWIRGARRQLSESFGSNLPVLRLHSDRGGEFSSDLLRAFCLSEGIRQTFTLPASPQQNGIAERRIGMVMDAARTSMIHAAAPHFLWPFAVQYAAHRINLQPRVSLPETTPTLRWTGKVGDVSVFRVWGSRAFVRDTSSTSCPPVPFPVSSLASLLTHPGGSSTTPPRTYRTASPPPPPLFLAPGTPLLDPLPPQGPGPSGVSQVDRAEPVEVAVDSGAETGRAESGGAETRGAESEGAETGRAELGGVEPEGTLSGGTEPARAAGGTGGASGATGGAGAARGGAGAGAAGVPAGAGAAGGAAGAGAGGGAAGAGAARGAAGAAGGAAGTGGHGAEGTGSVSAVSEGTARPRPYYVPLLQQPASPLPGPSPYSGPTRGLTERREPESRSTSPVRTVRDGRVSRPRLPPVPGTHSMTLRPSTAPQRVPLPSPPVSSLPDGPDPESDSLRAASPTVTRFLATAFTDPLFESSAVSALVAELVDFV
ncbi:unnamed protein product [Closterium sp. NIES-54]